jgi:tetratricopeptide (TPR) repeat protein
VTAGLGAKPADLLEARLLWARGDLKGARRIVETRLAREPQDSAAWLLMGELSLHDRDEEGALAAYRKAVAAAPGSSAAWNALARCFQAAGAVQEALAAARRAQACLSEGENFRETGPVYLTLVWCLRDLRQFKEALEAAEEGLARSPDAILAQWASVVEEEYAEAEKEEC